MENITALLTDPAAWAALATLIVMEIVLGVDNLVFIAILSNKLPVGMRKKARAVGLSLALILRLVLLASVAWIVQLTEPLFTLSGHAFSWRDLILIAGGLFLVWKATREIHQTVDPDPALKKDVKAPPHFSAAIMQILVLDIVFSIDSIVTAVGMTEHVPIMCLAVIVAVGVMMLAANPLSDFIHAHPTVVMLALGFLLMIGMTLIADGFGMHVPKGYIYTAMAFSALVETLNIFARKARRKKQK